MDGSIDSLALNARANVVASDKLLIARLPIPNVPTSRLSARDSASVCSAIPRQSAVAETRFKIPTAIEPVLLFEVEHAGFFGDDGPVGSWSEAGPRFDFGWREPLVFPGEEWAAG